jgi:hypothetical protein
MSEQPDQAWITRLRRRLDAAARNLDDADLARLRTARAAALRAAQGRTGRARAWPRSPWAWPVAGAMASAIAIAVAGLLWFAAPRAPLPQAMDSLEALALLDQAELYVDVDFYQWLAEQADKG